MNAYEHYVKSHFNPWLTALAGMVIVALLFLFAATWAHAGSADDSRTRFCVIHVQNIPFMRQRFPTAEVAKMDLQNWYANENGKNVLYNDAVVAWLMDMIDDVYGGVEQDAAWKNKQLERCIKATGKQT